MTPADKSANFKCRHSPIHGCGYDSRGQLRWICHDQDEHFAGEFFSEAAAREAVERWNTNHGDTVFIDWRAPPAEASGGHRGTYHVCVSGTNLKRYAWGMEDSAQVAAGMRDLIAEHGLETFMKFATALGGIK